jgi:hypothetical protein
LMGGVNLFGYVSANPTNLVDPEGLKDLDLGLGYSGRVDPFNYGGRSLFEIHVFGPDGKEIGLLGPDAEWLNKHGHKGKPAGIPDAVCDKARGEVVEQLRARNILPERGKIDIMGPKLGQVLRGAIRIGGVGAAASMAEPSVHRLCDLDPTHPAC